tara:strand:+ start:2070 stop:2372 length:303 start_codon:yes stop_codon:yes gene_type:complete
MIEKIKKNYLFLLVTFLFIYLFFNFLDGERGLISYLKKKNQLNSLQKIENKFINQISDLEHKNLLLTEKLDLDYIETLIRQKFLFGKKNEIIYIIKKNEN